MLLFWAYKSFQTLSLENENTYLLYRKSRWPIWMIMTFFTSTILTINFFDPWSYFIQRRIYDHATDSIIGPILTSGTIVLIVGGICLLIVFFKEVRTTINKLQHRTGWFLGCFRSLLSTLPYDLRFFTLSHLSILYFEGQGRDYFHFFDDLARDLPILSLFSYYCYRCRNPRGPS